MCVCVCVHACACVYVCVRACVCACAPTCFDKKNSHVLKVSHRMVKQRYLAGNAHKKGEEKEEETR